MTHASADILPLSSPHSKSSQPRFFFRIAWNLCLTVVTKEEIAGLMRNLLVTDSPPAGQTKVTDWAREHAATLGVKYASELAGRRDRAAAYERL